MKKNPVAYYINKNDWPTQATNKEPQPWVLDYFFSEVALYQGSKPCLIRGEEDPSLPRESWEEKKTGTSVPAMQQR